LFNRFESKNSKKKYLAVLKSLITGCQVLKKSKCKFIVIPCNTAHYWYDDLLSKVRLPIINMPKEVYKHAKKICKKKSFIGLLATEGTIKTGIYNKFFDEEFKLLYPSSNLQKNSVNKAIKFVKMGNVKAASKIIKPAINFLIKKRCKKIILGCTELPIAIFAFKSFKKIKTSKTFLDPNLILANAAVKKYKR
jgi:aspartate racemase